MAELKGARVLLRLPDWSSERVDRLREEALVSGFERRFLLRCSTSSAVGDFGAGEREDLILESIVKIGGEDATPVRL